MKYAFFLLLFCFFTSYSQSEKFTILTPPSSQSFEMNNDSTTVIETSDSELSEIVIKAEGLNGSDYILSSTEISRPITFNTSQPEHTIVFGELDQAELIITKEGETIMKTTINVEVEEIESNTNNISDENPYKSSEELIAEKFPDLVYRKRLGYFVKGSKDNNATDFVGDKYVHIFIDSFGNTILNSIPQGSPEITYIVHIITSLPIDKKNLVRYSVKQTKGGIDDILVFRNAGKLDDFKFNSSESEFFYYHSQYSLRESNSDIVFEIYKGENTEKGATNNLLNTFTIPIKIYNGSFDIGLLRSDLKNPSFTFSASADDQNLGKVKRDDGGSRGIVTAMATFYGSPVLAFRRIVLGQKDKVPAYKLTGRNYVSDHSLFERIYPAVGLSISDDTFDNIFYGFNWEIVKGGSLFAGWHYGKVNSFDLNNDEFEFETTEISKQDFELSTKNKWETDFAIGVNLDVLVILNLLQKGGSSN